jgi:ABC-type nitrate/sulfonate/bicarbonate transport system substrate-binding protein
MTHLRPGTAAIAAALMLAVAVTGCGGSGDDASSAAKTAASPSSNTARLPEPTDATLILDFVPNAVHAGIYRAVAAGYYEQNNLKLRILAPTSTSDPLKLIDAGRVDIGIADGINVASLIAKDRPVKGIMALTERPLAGIITLKKSGYTSPAALNGKTIGITGDPSDRPITKWIIDQGGGDYGSAKIVTIGFNGVTNLETGKVDAFTGFFPADGVQVQVDGSPTTIFRLDEYEAPSYPGLVVFSTDERIKEKPGVMKAFVDATVHGYQDTLKDPAQSLNDLLAQNRTLKRDLQAAQLKAFMPLFQGSAPRYGVFEPKVIDAFGAWLVHVGLLNTPFRFDTFATNQFMPPPG